MPFVCPINAVIVSFPGLPLTAISSSPFLLLLPWSKPPIISLASYLTGLSLFSYKIGTTSAAQLIVRRKLIYKFKQGSMVKLLELIKYRSLPPSLLNAMSSFLSQALIGYYSTGKTFKMSPLLQTLI